MNHDESTPYIHATIVFSHDCVSPIQLNLLRGSGFFALAHLMIPLGKDEAKLWQNCSKPNHKPSIWKKLNTTH
jgi:hypothetical protein